MLYVYHYSDTLNLYFVGIILVVIKANHAVVYR